MRGPRGAWGVRLWVTFLSVTFAALLLPTILPLHGLGMSLFYTGLGVAFIWLLYFAVGGLIAHAVAEEMRRRGIEPKP